MKEPVKLDLTEEELNNMPEGSIVSMGCHSCDGFEKHKRVGTTWVCQWCGNVEED